MNEITTYWLTRFSTVLNSRIADDLDQAGVAKHCRDLSCRALADMHSALVLEVPSDMLRHRIQAEARGINAAQTVLEIHPDGRIPTYWPRLEEMIENDILAGDLA